MVKQRLLIGIGTLLLMFCNGIPALAATGRTVVDQLGRTVTLPQKHCA